MSTTLREKRKLAADAKFENYNFGEHIVTDHDHWNEDGNFWSKKIYGDNPDGSRFCASFGVEFDHGSSSIVDMWCQNIA